MLQLGMGFVDTGSRLSRCCILAILVWCTHHLISYALDGGNLLVPTLRNWLLTHCCASRPDAETRCYIVRTLLIWFINGDTASYLGSSELLKIRWWSKLSVHFSWSVSWTACEMRWIEILRCVCGCLREVKVITSIDSGWKTSGFFCSESMSGWKTSGFWFWIYVRLKNFRFLVLNLCHN